MQHEIDLELAESLLANWMSHTETYIYEIPERPELLCYGSGYNSWGVQTNQKYLSAMATLSELGQYTPQSIRNLARERALKALRFSLASHVSGDLHCTDGTQWGHTWISGLGVERMMHGVYLLLPHMTDHDRAALRRMLVSESEWLLTEYRRGSGTDVSAGLWGKDGKNDPESNIWNGALLWRTAMMYPDHPSVEAWKERAHCFLINGVSVPGDEENEELVAGRAVKDRYVGANFFPNYGLDHHAYFNVGYMMICMSNAAMLHFDMRSQGYEAPESLYHHQTGLWQNLRRMLFADGRLARLGGDTRVRYSYCQEYLLPSLAFAADHLDEGHAASLGNGHLALVAEEAGSNTDGSFYGSRLRRLAKMSPYYYTRLESDRACTLGMLLCYWRQIAEPPSLAQSFEHSVQGGWVEQEHGSVMHRSPGRLASFAWRANGLTQGLCCPPHDGHLTEWSENLAGEVRFLGESRAPRELIDYHIDPFEGGFVTCGRVGEGCYASLAEGWHREQAQAIHHIAFAALPDGHTVVGLQLCQTTSLRSYLASVKGMKLNLPNDLFNGYRRRLVTEAGELMLGESDDAHLDLDSVWLSIEDLVGAIAIYGAAGLSVSRSKERRGGKYNSLYVDEICCHHVAGPIAAAPDSTILDVGWAVLSGVSASQTRLVKTKRLELPGLLRGIEIVGQDGIIYQVVANFGERDAAYSSGALGSHSASVSGNTMDW